MSTPKHALTCNGAMMTVTEFLSQLVPPPVVISDEQFEVRRADVTVTCKLRTWGRKRKVREWRCWIATAPVEEIDNVITALRTTQKILVSLNQFEQLQERA